MAGILEFPADNRGVRRAPAVIGNNAARTGHNRDPVRIGHFSDQNGIISEFADIADMLDYGYFPGGNGFSDGQPGDQALAFFF